MNRFVLNGVLIAVICLIGNRSTQAGSILGEVKFVDAPPMLQPIKITKDRDYCGETLPDETYLIEVSGGLKNVVVFIESAPSGKQANPQKENFLYNDGCPYAPRVMAFQKGERLESKATIRSSTFRTAISARKPCSIFHCRSRTPPSTPLRRSDKPEL